MYSGVLLFMRSEEFNMRDFFVEVCELWRPEVASDWRDLKSASIVYLSRPGSEDTDGIEVVFGRDELQLSMGRHLSLDLSIQEVQGLALAKTLVLSAVADGATTWKCSRRNAFAFGHSSTEDAWKVLGCEDAPIPDVHWESWLSDGLASETWRRFDSLERTAWFRAPLWQRVYPK